MIRTDWHDFDFSQLDDIKPAPRRKGNPAGRGKNRPEYLPIIATMDTETTTLVIDNRKHAFVYVWMFYFPHIDTMITGRVIADYDKFLKELSGHLSAVLLCFVHNLSFEYSYISGVYQFGTDPKNPDVFSVKPRKILTARMYKVEHRCSMMLSNLSLAAYTKEMGVEHKKLSGQEFDYSKIRYPWTDLSAIEWAYCTHDVVGLAECVKKEMELSGKDIYHFPLTSTGFVRQDLRFSVRHIADNLFKKIQPDFNLYQALRRAFRGGDTHANRLIVGEPVPAGFSRDRSSSYPDVQCNRMFPMSVFKPCERLDWDYVWERHEKYNKALLLVVKLYDVELRDENWGFPYIPADYWHVDLPKSEDYGYDPVVYDNGRVLSTPWVYMIVTDVDMAIILEEYRFSIEIYQAWEARYGYLPPAFTDVVKYYYGMKTKLKGDDSQKVMYNKMKARLNSVYGCTAQDIIKADLTYNDEICNWIECVTDKDSGNVFYAPHPVFTSSESEFGEALEMAWNKVLFDLKIEGAWLPYQYAVWTTSLARFELHRGLWNVHSQGGLCLYCDTDSVKYIGDHVTWDALNQSLMDNSVEHGAFADDKNGERHYMGVWEKEGKATHSFQRFATLGAKKYAYEELDPKECSLDLHCTIAAVSKKKGAAELAAAFGPYALDRFALCRANENEFVFRDAGGTALIYNDDDDITICDSEGNDLHIGRNVVITDDTYELSMSDDYERLVKNSPNRIYFEGGIDEQ